MIAADLDDRAVDEHHLQAEHVVRRHPVFQTMRAAGIHADIAGDRAGELRGWIGRIKEAVRHNGIGDAEIGDAGFDAHRAVGVIDGQDARHLGDAQHHRILLRDGAAGKRSAGAARHDVDAIVETIAHDARRLSRRAG